MAKSKEQKRREALERQIPSYFKKLHGFYSEALKLSLSVDSEDNFKYLVRELVPVAWTIINNASHLKINIAGEPLYSWEKTTPAWDGVELIRAILYSGFSFNNWIKDSKQEYLRRYPEGDLNWGSISSQIDDLKINKCKDLLFKLFVVNR